MKSRYAAGSINGFGLSPRSSRPAFSRKPKNPECGARKTSHGKDFSLRQRGVANRIRNPTGRWLREWWWRSHQMAAMRRPRTPLTLLLTLPGGQIPCDRHEERGWLECPHVGCVAPLDCWNSVPVLVLVWARSWSAVRRARALITSTRYSFLTCHPFLIASFPIPIRTMTR